MTTVMGPAISRYRLPTGDAALSFSTCLTEIVRLRLPCIPIRAPFLGVLKRFVYSFARRLQKDNPEMDSGWLRLVLVGFGWFWLASAGSGWLLVLDLRFGPSHGLKLGNVSCQVFRTCMAAHSVTACWRVFVCSTPPCQPWCFCCT